MPAHPEFLRSFDSAIRGGTLPPGVTAVDPAEVPRRFAVYQNNVAVGLTDALATRFPVIRRLVGEAFFSAMARLYSEQHRPETPLLFNWGENLAAFLEGFPPLSGFGYMGDVARIEFARGQAFHAADGTPIAGEALIGADPEALQLRLHASVRVLRLDHPAVSIWAANQPNSPAPGAIPKGGEIALIYRSPDFDVPVRAISPAEAVFVTALAAGRTLAVAATEAASVQPDFDPSPLLLAFMQNGLFLDPKVA